MKTLVSVAVAGIAMACAVIVSTPGKAAPREAGLETITAAAFDGTVIRVADRERDGAVELSARKKKKGGHKGGNKSSKRGGNRGAHRGHRGGDNGAAIAAGVLGVIGGLIAADQARQAEEDGYYDDEPPPPPPRHWERRCPYGVWIDQDGFEHCRR